MQIYNTLDNIDQSAKGGVIAIGNFDGVHLGHQALLAQAKKIAAAENKKFGVLTFEPHPRRLFQPDQPPGRLTTAALKAQRLEAFGVDYLFSLNFDWPFASQSAEEFVQNILINGLDAAHIVIGYNFRFGQMRKGDSNTIESAGIPVSVINPVEDEKNETVSSSRIRQLLRVGDIAAANKLLGWEWEVQGKIFRGDRRGHDLGYPTANILLNDTLHPAYGVYACLVQIEGEDDWRPAATNIGIRPMFEVKEGQIEAHILNFPDRDIYDKVLRVKPIERIRSEAKFGSLDDLIVQMEKDCEKTRQILS
ncbi:MAG TPA: bifunctional riboflavin kinase/FAD synthetase [Alphaproteobacteria bacterium]|nr:bifunctional riboflavin kinase/FAD synthetase [Alphaproteobacteria bacterium]